MSNLLIIEVFGSTIIYMYLKPAPCIIMKTQCGIVQEDNMTYLTNCTKWVISYTIYAIYHDGNLSYNCEEMREYNKVNWKCAE